MQPVYSTIFICLLLVLQATESSFGQGGKGQKRGVAKLEAFQRRDGLPNFYHKIQAGQEVRVAYLGGSITEAEGGWRELSFNALRVRFPTTPFKQINAGIGGTGSDLGVFRLQEDVLIHHPDLLLVEFAVNDANRSSAAIYRSMEGIVRKTWKADPSTDILFVYTLTQKMADTLRAGLFPHAAAAMERVAQHYRISSLHMGLEVARLAETGKLVFTGQPGQHPGKIVFSNDGVHPYATSGHPIYAHVLMKHLAALEAEAPRRHYRLPDPLVSDNWEDAQIVPLSRLFLDPAIKALSPEHALSQQFRQHLPTIYKAAMPGDSIHFRFRGTLAGGYDLMGPGTGNIEAVVDGQPPLLISRFDAYCTYYRKNHFLLPQLPNQVHTVTFRVSSSQPDKEAILLQRQITMANPDLFQENDWLVGKLLILGEIID